MSLTGLEETFPCPFIGFRTNTWEGGASLVAKAYGFGGSLVAPAAQDTLRSPGPRQESFSQTLRQELSELPAEEVLTRRGTGGGRLRLCEFGSSLREALTRLGALRKPEDRLA